MAKLRFTSSALVKHFEGQESRGIVWDTEARGLGAYKNAKSVTLFVHFRLANGQQRKKVLGRLDEINLSEARSIAQQYRLAARRGLDLVKEEKARAQRSLTLGEAYREYREHLRRRCVSANTHLLNDRLWRLMLVRYENREMTSITKKDVRAWHTAWGEHRPTAANQGGRLLRTIWNHASKYVEGFPPNPCTAIEFFKERELRRSVSWCDLPQWFSSLDAIENPSRRAYWKLLLYSGLRKEDAASIRWDEIGRDSIRRPNPKGGRTKAFDLPLTGQIRAVLDEARRAHASFDSGSPYVFPSASKTGYLSNPREPDALPGLSPHDMRRTYATACAEAGVDPYVMKMLLNHAIDKSDVTALYVRHSDDYQCAAAQRVADFIEAKGTPHL